MKNYLKKLVSPKIFVTIFLSVAIMFGAFAQQDTTKIEMHNKKIVIIDGKTHKKQAIENLEKGIVTFNEEIAKSNASITELNAKIEQMRAELETATNKEEIERNIELQEKLIEVEETKIEAFENGIEDINEGIADIEEDLSDIPDIERFNDSIVITTDDEDNHSCNNNKMDGNWAGFEMGVANFLTSTNAIAKDAQTNFMKLNPEKSFTYNLNLFEYTIPLVKKYAGIVTGAGIEWNSYSLSENVNLVEDANNVIQANYIDPAVIDYKKNNLNMAYLTIPALLEFQIPTGKENIYISAGATGSLRMWSKQKQKYFDNDTKMKNKVTDDFQLTPFRYGLTFRIGYGDIGLFANYEITPLFKEGAGPELYPFTIGVRIINF